MEFDSGMQRLDSLKAAFKDIVGRDPTQKELDRVAVTEVKMFDVKR